MALIKSYIHAQLSVLLQQYGALRRFRGVNINACAVPAGGISIQNVKSACAVKSERGWIPVLIGRRIDNAVSVRRELVDDDGSVRRTRLPYIP